MKNIALIIITFCLGLGSVKAQLQVPASYGNSIAIAAEGGLLLGPVTQRYKAGAGLVLKGEMLVAQSFNLTGSVGFQAFLPNSTYAYYLNANQLPYTTLNFIPVKVGGRYYIGDTWYAEAETGAVLYTTDYRDPAITIGAGTGFSFQLDGVNRAVDVGARIENWTRKDIPGQYNVSQMLAFRLAYKFGL